MQENKIKIGDKTSEKKNQQKRNLGKRVEFNKQIKRKRKEAKCKLETDRNQEEEKGI